MTVAITKLFEISELRSLKLEEACDGDHRVAVQHRHPVDRLDDVPEELVEPGGQVERESRGNVILGAGRLLELRELALDRLAVLADRFAGVGEAATERRPQFGSTRCGHDACERN